LSSLKSISDDLRGFSSLSNQKSNDIINNIYQLINIIQNKQFTISNTHVSNAQNETNNQSKLHRLKDTVKVSTDEIKPKHKKIYSRIGFIDWIKDIKKLFNP